MNLLKISCIAILLAMFTSCGTYFNQPVDVKEARIGETSKVTQELRDLPEPKEQVVVGVYNFRDLTGQYKASEVGSTFSTAVTQGATPVLIKALEDSGWFTAIERENIGNLLNERNIIRSTRQEYSRSGANPNEPQLPPLLYAGILLEGGIVSYDTNIITGGMGARYFGVGGSTQYREDRITIYLRAISTSSGKILKNIYVSKTILSQALDASLFKYVNFQRLLEAEVGFTRNEPVQLAVKEAIEKAVKGLIVEGIADGIWSAKEASAGENLVQQYSAEKEEAGLTKLYDRKYVERNNSSLSLDLGGALISGDYANSEAGALVRLAYNAGISPSFALNLAVSGFELRNKNSFSEKFASLDVNGKFLLLPNDNFGPYLYGGPGVMMNIDSAELPEGIGNTHFKLQYGLGLEYLISPKLGLKAFAEHNIALDDELDYVINGKRDDHFFNFGVGVNFYLGKSKQEKNK